MVRVDKAVARAQRGLEGDRYFYKRGTFSNPDGVGYDLTLIEAEVLDTLQLPAGELAPEQPRRNLITRGIDLNALVGRAVHHRRRPLHRTATLRAVRAP